ncbi:hypothetical protein ACFCXC_12320 [Streptomyces microflavus]|uniref:hypothetical protein n=1 Tax=Streptomyces microflavus TaxID=1919 RepID=UPI0035D72D42
MDAIWAENPALLEVLVIIDWRDGPIEGIVRHEGGKACWYFKLFAERLETSTLDDRLFGFWPIPEPAASVLVEEFGQDGRGAQVWPVSGGIGSVEARRIVDGLLSAGRGSPGLMVRTPDLAEVSGVWGVVPD